MNQESFLITSLAIATVSMTITKSSLFKKFRNFFTLSIIKKLLNCPYCLNHWLAFPWIFEFGIIGAVALVALASIWSLLILIFLEKLGAKNAKNAKNT